MRTPQLQKKALPGGGSGQEGQGGREDVPGAVPPALRGRGHKGTPAQPDAGTTSVSRVYPTARSGCSNSHEKVTAAWRSAKTRVPDFAGWTGREGLGRDWTRTLPR